MPHIYTEVFNCGLALILLYIHRAYLLLGSLDMEVYIYMCVYVDRISSAVLRGVSHKGRLIGRGACNQEQEGNRDT